MVKHTKITMNLGKLDKIVGALDNNYVTRVGVLGAKNARNSDPFTGNADIGAVHEFGSETNNIQPRSFLRMPLTTKNKELMKSMGAGSVKAAVKTGNIKKIFEILGKEAELIVQQAFATAGFGQWPTLEEETIRRKGSSAILIDTGQLRRAVTSDVVDKDSV